jgi:hypothetical protein
MEFIIVNPGPPLSINIELKQLQNHSTEAHFPTVDWLCHINSECELFWNKVQFTNMITLYFSVACIDC